MAGNSKSLRRKRIQYLLTLIAESSIDRPRRPRLNPRVIKQRNSSFPLKNEDHKGEKFVLDEELNIIGAQQENENPQKLNSNVIQADFSNKSKRNNKKHTFFKKVINYIRLKAS